MNCEKKICGLGWVVHDFEGSLICAKYKYIIGGGSLKALEDEATRANLSSRFQLRESLSQPFIVESNLTISSMLLVSRRLKFLKQRTWLRLYWISQVEQVLLILFSVIAL